MAVGEHSAEIIPIRGVIGTVTAPRRRHDRSKGNVISFRPSPRATSSVSLGKGLAMVVIADPDPRQIAVSIARASTACAKARRALVIEVTSPCADAGALRQALLTAFGKSRPSRPPAFSVVVPPSLSASLYAISKELAMRGLILGNFDAAHAHLAIEHAMRERRLVLAEEQA